MRGGLRRHTLGTHGPIDLVRLEELEGEGPQLVQRALGRAGVAHRRLIHPAARGAIRARATYQAHVATVLGRRQDAATDHGTAVASPAFGKSTPNDGSASTDQTHPCSSEEAH